MSKFAEHMGYLASLLPEFGGLYGFFFYSFMTYLFVLFIGWLLNPTVDKIIEDDIKAQRIHSKGQRARQMNLDNAKKNQEKADWHNIRFLSVSRLIINS